MDKVLLVIGASSDMGIATIKELGEDYTYIIAHYRTMNSDLELLGKEMGNKMICLQADLVLQEDVLKLIEEIKLTKLELETAYSHFENVVDPDLISSSIYHINSIQERYKYLLKLLKSIEEEAKQKDRLSANQSS